MSFTSGVLKYAKKTGLSLDKSIIAIATEASVSIIKRTPVDKGRARANWFASINSVSSETSETRSEGEAISDAVSTARKASGAIFNLTNNLPYIHRLEYGYSKQSAQGMVRITSAKIEQMLKKI